MIELKTHKNNIDLTTPRVYKNPVNPYIDTTLIKDWTAFFQSDRRIKDWDITNTSWVGAETLYQCFMTTTLYEPITVDSTNCKGFGYAFNNAKFTKIKLDTTNAETMNYTFRQCTAEEIELVGSTKKVTTFSYCFNGATVVHTIKGIDFSGIKAAAGITSMFQNNPKLVNCVVTGKLKIFSNNFKISPCPNLSRESVLSFANAIQDNTGGTRYTLYFGAENLAKLTEEEKEALIAKNFTLA